MIKDCKPWDARFFALCNLVGSWSEDQERKVGCVIVGSANDVRAIGFNGFPRKVKSRPERHKREDKAKYLWFEHAERNAIYNLARVSGHAEDCRMYVNSFPCADCARAIIQVGIKELHTFPYDKDDKNFSEHYIAAKKMFDSEDANIPVNLYSRNDPLIK